MADLGFLPGVKRIMDRTPKVGQRMLFSATLDNGVDVLVRRYLSNPTTHSVDPAVAPVSTMTHHVFRVDAADKATIVKELASGLGRSVLFTRTKHQAKKLAKQLTAAGVPAVDLHGNLSQNARERNLEAFTSGETRVLCATDIAARGIHVDDVAIVVHVDPPAEHKAYLHRSGRTARAGAEGAVVTIATPDQAGEVRTLGPPGRHHPRGVGDQARRPRDHRADRPGRALRRAGSRRRAAAPGQRRRTTSQRLRSRILRRRRGLGWAQRLGQRRQVRRLGSRVRAGPHPRRARRPRRLLVGRLVQRPLPPGPLTPSAGARPGPGGARLTRSSMGTVVER